MAQSGGRIAEGIAADRDDQLGASKVMHRAQLAVRQRGGQDADAIGMLALLVPLKGVDVFLRAAARLAPDHPGWRFTVFGDGPEAQPLGALQAELGLNGAVTMPGFVASAQALDSRLEPVSSAIDR